MGAPSPASSRRTQPLTAATPAVPCWIAADAVIGINTAIFSPTSASAGVGFAVPVDTIHRVLPDLLKLGRYRHPWLGIRYAYSVTPGLAEILKLPVSQGCC